MSDYTPTIEDVRAPYERERIRFQTYGDSEDFAREEFDRWLAKVKREAIADWQLAQLAATIEATRGDNK